VTNREKKTFTIPMHDVDRAIADGEVEGFMKTHISRRRWRRSPRRLRLHRRS
jgi:hypothetical protein